MNTGPGTQALPLCEETQLSTLPLQGFSLLEEMTWGPKPPVPWEVGPGLLGGSLAEPPAPSGQ